MIYRLVAACRQPASHPVGRGPGRPRSATAQRQSNVRVNRIGNRSLDDWMQHIHSLSHVPLDSCTARRQTVQHSSSLRLAAAAPCRAFSSASPCSRQQRAKEVPSQLLHRLLDHRRSRRQQHDRARLPPLPFRLRLHPPLLPRELCRPHRPSLPQLLPIRQLLQFRLYHSRHRHALVRRCRLLCLPPSVPLQWRLRLGRPLLHLLRIQCHRRRRQSHRPCLLPHRRHPRLGRRRLCRLQQPPVRVCRSSRRPISV